MNKPFVLELQQELLAAGYEDVELRYLSEDGNTIAMNLTHDGVLRKVGLVITGDVAVQHVDGDMSAGASCKFASVKELARWLFDRDPGTKHLPDFRKFTGLTLAQPE